MKGYRTYLACFLAAGCALAALVLHVNQPTGMRPSVITDGVVNQPIDWVFWLNIAATALSVAAGVFRQLAAKDYAGALQEVTRLREMLANVSQAKAVAEELLMRRAEETVDYQGEAT